MPLIVTGTIGIDTIHAPTGIAEEVLGGSAAYFAASASFHAPEKVRLVAAVGEDFGDAHLATLAHFQNLCTDGLEVRSGSKTFRWGGRYHTNMNKRDTIFIELGVVSEKPPVPPAQYADSKYIFLANTHPSVQLQMLEAFPDRALAVADTIDLWIDGARDDLVALLARIDGVVLDNNEAALLTGATNPLTSGKKILEMGPRFAIIKKGEHGCILVHRDGVAALPAIPKEDVVDPTGAGDSFAGGLMGYLAKAHAGGADDPAPIHSLRTGMAYGTVMASFCIESFSLDRMKTLTPDEVTARYEAFRRIVCVD